MPVWLFCLVGLLLMDLIGAYSVHWIQHKIPWMWKFHVIHHSDQHLDTTSANRHHPGESLFRLIFTIFAVVLIGAPMWMVFFYQTVSVILTQFNHSNIHMNDNIDKMLRWVFCTPNMHRVHHHYQQPLTDKNYGNIFSFWDRIFGTYIEYDNKKIVYGVDTYMARDEAEDLGTMLQIPFLPYRPSPSNLNKE